MIIKVRAHAGSRKEMVRKDAPEKLDIYVREKAERGEANARIRAIVARIYGVPLSRARLVKGRTSPNKAYEIL